MRFSRARLGGAAIAIAIAIASSGCGGDRSRAAAGPDKSASEGGDRAAANERDTHATRDAANGAASGGGCERAVGAAFVRCLDDMYEARHYPQMLRSCEAALKAPHEDVDKATIAETCITLLPPALWIGGEPKDAVSLVAAACEKATDEQRVDRAARETLILLRGVSHGAGTDEEKKTSVKQALVAWATSCQVEPERVAKRVLELGKSKD